jgi:RNA polymerase sigma-70 factor (sigma-E family)
VVLDFEEYVSARGTALVRFAVMLCGDRHRAEDVVQAGLARAYRSWRRISAMERPEAYVKRIILREWLSWRRLRSSSELPVDAFADDDATAVPPPPEPSVLSALWQAMALLPARQRAVLVLRYYEDLPDSEIAALLGCAEATVRSLAARSLAQLRTNVSVAEDRTPHD